MWQPQKVRRQRPVWSIKRQKDLSERRQWNFTEGNTCTISSTGSYSDITFPPHKSHWCTCSASAWLTSGCELFILLKPIWANILIFSFPILPVRTVNAILTKFGPNIHVAQVKERMRTGASDRCPNKADGNLICNEVIPFHLFSFCQFTNNSN